MEECNHNTDPNNPDTDGDGWNDKEDNRPLDKGIYSESAGKIVVGELTIVSSLYNFYLVGHSYLVYKSYINDTLDFSGLSGGYELLNNNTEYMEVEAGLYNISRCESVSLGNTMKSIDGDFELIEYRVDSDDVGIFYNREFALEVDEFYRILSTEPLYNKNRAYTQQITNDQLNKCIDEHKRLDYYDILWNNCVDVAGKSWKATFGTDEFIVSNLPVYLYAAIMRKNGDYEFDNWKALGYR